MNCASLNPLVSDLLRFTEAYTYQAKAFARGTDEHFNIFTWLNSDGGQLPPELARRQLRIRDSRLRERGRIRGWTYGRRTA